MQNLHTLEVISNRLISASQCEVRNIPAEYHLRRVYRREGEVRAELDPVPHVRPVRDVTGTRQTLQQVEVGVRVEGRPLCVVLCCTEMTR